MVLVEDTWNLLTSNPSLNTRDLSTTEKIGANATEKGWAELTGCEKLLHQGWTALRPLVRRVVLGAEAELAIRLFTSLAQLKMILNSNHASITALDKTAPALPDRNVIQFLVLQLEFLKACSKLSSLLSSYQNQKSQELKGKLTSDETQSLMEKVVSVAEGV